MQTRKIPMRKCIVTNERVEKKDLIRVVKTKEGDIFVDETGKANGRGAYLTLNKAVIKKAKDKKILDRVFETEIPDTVFEELMKLYEKRS